MRQFSMSLFWLALSVPVAVGFVAAVVFYGLSAGLYYGRQFVEQEASR